MVRGTLGDDPDGITYSGELKRMELSNPDAADVLVEKGGVIVIETKGGTDYTIDDTTKIDANTFDRNSRQAFDFRLPNEWVDVSSAVPLEGSMSKLILTSRRNSSEASSSLDSRLARAMR